MPNYSKIIKRKEGLTREGGKIKEKDISRKASKEFPNQSPTKVTKGANILVFNSEDKYIRNILVQNNWVINPDVRSKYYNLRWVFKPLPQNYNDLRPQQFINHIKNSH